MTVDFPDRLDIARLPTPTRPLTRTSAELDGVTVWVKHDDDTGGLMGGNKIRKLQYLVCEAMDGGADTLITCGGLQSNHCRATAALARQLGLHVALCLRGEPPEHLEGNFLLDRMLGADIHFLTPEQYADNASHMGRVAKELAAAGRKPFVIGEGGSMATGCWGYIEAAREIAEVQSRVGVTFDHVVCAAGSGGTSAGLELGVRLLGLEAKVLHFAVCDDEAYFRDRIHALCVEARDKFGLAVDVPAGEIRVDDGFVGDGYGITTREQLRTMVAVGHADGLVLDPVYSGKAFFGLLERLRANRIPGARNVLFVHTGGLFGLQPHAKDLAAVLHDDA